MPSIDPEGSDGIESIVHFKSQPQLASQPVYRSFLDQQRLTKVGSEDVSSKSVGWRGSIKEAQEGRKLCNK
jgi:hypothetical protein